MAHPKRRQSNTRTATVCPTCGYYRGKIAIVMDEAAE